WNITANLIYMTHFDSVTDRPQISPCPAASFGGFGLEHGCNPDALNLDLTVTKKYGKWKFGPVAYGSWDLTSPRGLPEQRQFNVGGLVGYDFGNVILQTYVTTGVFQDNYGGNDTRVWSRVIVPFATQAAPKGKM